MNTEIRINEAAMEVKLSGRLDSATAPELDKAVTPRLEGITALTLDFTELLYLSSAGLRVILSLKKKMNAVEGTLCVLNPNEMIMDVFEATGFADILDVRKEEQA